jgi:peptidoglycan/LPS O-acetylase OafA/YrhL
MKREFGVDFARLLAAYLVLLGHFVLHGALGADPATQALVGAAESLPLLNKDNFWLWRLDYYLLQNWNTAFAILGVALFFIISGWIVPSMLDRYSRREFLKNRIFRIMPMLVVAVGFTAALQFFFGDASSISIRSVLSTAFLANQFTGDSVYLGVVWTLLIEVKFFALLFIFGRLTNKKILFSAIVLSTLIFLQFLIFNAGWYAGQQYLMGLMNSLAHDAHYLIFMLVGASAWRAFSERQSVKENLTPFFILALFNVGRFLLKNGLSVAPAQDLNGVTQLVVIILFSLCLIAQFKLQGENFIARGISRWATITYSLYLLHVGLGFFLISRLRHFVENPYLLLIFITMIVSLAAAGTYQWIEKPFNMLGRCRHANAA